VSRSVCSTSSSNSGFVTISEAPTRARYTGFRGRPSRSSFNLVHLASGVKVDLFVKGRSNFDASEFDRRVVVRLGDDAPRDVFVKSAEDTILRKLLWFRLGGEVSDRQWEDVRGIVDVQATRLDVEYLTHWAKHLGIRDLLEKALEST
jgi:hypothetical protein